MKRKFLLLVMMCIFGGLSSLFAQETVVTIDGTGKYEQSTSQYVPVWDNYEYAITQQIYTAEEIGISEGTITSIAFKKTAGVSSTRTLTIYMAETDDLNFGPSGRTTKAMTDDNIVFTGEVEFSADNNNDWTKIQFPEDKKFEYHGKNILVCINDITNEYISINDGNSYFETFVCYDDIDGYTAYRALYQESTSKAFNANNTISSCKGSLQIPSIQFIFSSTGTTYPDKPVLNTPKNGADNQFFPELNFTLGKNTTHYQICYKFKSAEKFTSVTGDSWIPATDVKNYILKDLIYQNSSYNTYEWKVIARNHNDPSDATEAVITSSDIYTFTTAKVSSPTIVSSSYNEETETTTISWTHNTIENESGDEDRTITYNVYVNGSKVENTNKKSYEIASSSLNIGNNTIGVSVVKGANESAKSNINIKRIVYGKVSGQTTDDTGNALQDVIVTFTNSNIDEPYTFTTNEEGMFSSNEILLGNYTVTFEKYGYNTIEQEVEITDTENVTSIGVISMSPAIAIYDNSGWNMEPENKDVIIKANATIYSELTVKSITIEENASLTLEAGANLTVIGKLTNTDAANLIIKDGAQLFQKNENVPATFIMDITKPTGEWDDSKNITGWQFISSPFTNASITNFTENIEGDYDLYKYDRDKMEWFNHKVEENTFEEVFEPGRGYLASYQSEETAEITGILNNNTTFSVNLPFAWSDPLLKYFHLLGNPFPFDMNLENFTWYNTVNGFAIVNAEGGYDYSTNDLIKTIPAGDGFFVKATGDNPSLSYTHKARSSQEKANSINVIASGKAGKDNVVIRFAGQAEGFDKLQNFNDAIATVYVSENGKNYGIANVDENTTEVALNFDAKEMGSYTISLDINGEFETVTLVDRFTGVETNMLIEDEYNFVATSKDMKNRFVVRLGNGQEPTDNGQFVYQNGEELILSIEGSVQIVDMLGRVVYSNEHADAYNRINVAEFKDATYVVRVVNEEGVKVQKVVIY